uniref:Uncharacterized protein n=1 Tax=Romanomermis culicivorax TaxID=13658 RepID=A0A915J8R2_ROMCU
MSLAPKCAADTRAGKTYIFLVDGCFRRFDFSTFAFSSTGAKANSCSSSESTCSKEGICKFRENSASKMASALGVPLINLAS